MLRVRSAVRYAFTPLAALSLLLFIVMCVLWPRSYSRADGFTLKREQGQRPETLGEHELGKVEFAQRTSKLEFYEGRVRFAYLWNQNSVAPGPPGFEHFESFGGDDAGPWPAGPLGMVFYRFSDELFPGERAGGIVVILPIALATMAFALVPAFALLASLRRRRSRRRGLQGKCPRCGYDLCGHSGNGARCPEWGTAIAG